MRQLIKDLQIGGTYLTIPKNGWKLIEDFFVDDFYDKTKDLVESYTVSYEQERMNQKFDKIYFGLSLFVTTSHQAG